MMAKIIRALIFLVCFIADVYAQSTTEDFVISLPNKKVNKSLYNKIEVVYQAHDTTGIGIVQLGTSNKRYRVVTNPPLAVQIENVMHALTDFTARKGTLLINIRQLSFAEINGTGYEKGYMHFRACLYSQNNSYYNLIQSIDTVAEVIATDVTKSLLRTGSKIISGFIASNLLKAACDTQRYSYLDISSIDSIERQQTNLYKAYHYTDGVYTTFKSFKNQIPDYSVAATIKGDKLLTLRLITADGNFESVERDSTYAVVVNGKPFVATEYGYAPLQKRNDDFYFIGKAKVATNKDPVIMASVLFGIIGGLFTASLTEHDEALFEMKIDHLSGSFIRIREIAKK